MSDNMAIEVGKRPQQKDTRNRTPVVKRIEHDLIAAAAAIGVAVGGMAAIGETTGKNPLDLIQNPGHHQVLPTTFPSEKPSPFISPEPTAIPTPEAPKVAYWTKDQITQAQQEGLAQGRVLLLDTWTQVGGQAITGTSPNGHLQFGITGIKTGTDILAPIEGKEQLSGLGSTPPVKIVDINNIDTNERIISYYLNPEAETVSGLSKVRPGDKIATIKAEDNTTAFFFNDSNKRVPMELIIATSLKQLDILRDPNGSLVQLAPGQ
jgi:hypothetical protein